MDCFIVVFVASCVMMAFAWVVHGVCMACCMTCAWRLRAWCEIPCTAGGVGKGGPSVACMRCFFAKLHCVRLPAATLFGSFFFSKGIAR